MPPRLSGAGPIAWKQLLEMLRNPRALIGFIMSAISILLISTWTLLNLRWDMVMKYDN
jgi:hypothetical protein